MRDKVDLVEAEGLDMVDFGNAAEETRQYTPFPAHSDSAYGLGLWPG